MDALAYVVTSGWASGISVYATVLVTGLAGRFGGLDSVPDGFERTDVLVIAAVLTACEFLADKIPYVDSAWDDAPIQRVRQGLRRLQNRFAGTTRGASP
jgi:hypothetical protein